MTRSSIPVVAQEINHSHTTSLTKNIHHQQIQETMRNNHHNHIPNNKIKQQQLPTTAAAATSSSLLLSPTSNLEVNNKDVFKTNTKINDQSGEDLKNQKEKQTHTNRNKDKENEKIIDDYFTLPPKALLSPTTTRDIYENRLKPASSTINHHQSVSSPKSKSTSTSVSPPVTTTTVTAQRRRDLKLQAEQQNHEQIELNKASLRQGDEVAL